MRSRVSVLVEQFAGKAKRTCPLSSANERRLLWRDLGVAAGETFALLARAARCQAPGRAASESGGAAVAYLLRFRQLLILPVPVGPPPPFFPSASTMVAACGTRCTCQSAAPLGRLRASAGFWGLSYLLPPMRVNDATDGSTVLQRRSRGTHTLRLSRVTPAWRRRT